MADDALFIGWGEAVRGREERALGGLPGDRSATGMQAQQRRPDRQLRAVSCCEPHGGGLAGFMLVRGERAQLDALRADEEFERLMARAGPSSTTSASSRGLRRRGARRQLALPAGRRARSPSSRRAYASAAARCGSPPRPRAAARSSTGAVCSARRRTSFHDRPSFTSAGIPIDDGGRDLDRLQDDPVAERVRLRDAVAAAQHDDARGLEDAEVRRRRRQHRRHVDREQHRRRGAEAGPIVEPERDEQHVAGQPLQHPGRQLRGERGAAELRVAEDGEPRRARARARRAPGPSARAASRSASGARRSAAAAPAARSRAARSGAIAAKISASWWLRNSLHRRERHDRRAASSARMFSSVCETIVPSTIGRCSRGRPVRRATTSARDGLAEARRQRRAHQHADERALHRVAQAHAPVRDRRLAGSRARRPRARPSRRT